MYKLKVYIYLNRVPFPPSLKSCGLKNLMKLGVVKKISKTPSRRGLHLNHAQRNENQKHPRGEIFSAKKIAKTPSRRGLEKRYAQLQNTKLN